MVDHIISHDHKIKLVDRISQSGFSPKLIWFTGLSGSGKSTLADVLEQKLFNKGCQTYILDGDNIRQGLNQDLDFSEKGRHENIRRIAEVSRLFLDAGVIVITAFISPFQKDRALARSIIGESNFIEVFVDCPLETCEQRDVKGLYAKARAGKIPNFTGIDSPFERPESPDLIIKTQEQSLEESMSIMNVKIVDRILTKS